MSALTFCFLLCREYVRIVVQIARRPILEGVGRGEVGLNNENSDDSENEHYACDKSPLIERSVGVRGFILAVEGLRTACNSSRKTVLVALLQNNSDNDENSRGKEHYKKNVLKNAIHRKKPFKIFLRAKKAAAGSFA